MWIKKSTYNEMLDLINQQRKEIEYLKIERIKTESRYQKAINIDFPNSQKGGFEGSDIFTM